ncbi:MAG TPA: NAD(P)-binding domain-containing protein [Anaerolineae bacterium]|nr:NAD(P)-binding domain-containing protein [Anaerolineae bacterium]
MIRETTETVIVGGGQAGVATSYWLKQHGREHIVLEKAERPGHAWRQRWDSFTLVTPNWMFRLPGTEYHGAAPGEFMPRDEIVATFERYVADHALPVSFGVDVTAIEPLAGRSGYRVRTTEKDYETANVVIATGLFQRAKIPAFAANLPADVQQLSSEQYRNPAALPPGAVLVVGSGQSGCQIAEELRKSGRRVFLSVGTCGRAPRRYRGKDIFDWLDLIHFLDRTPDMLPSPKARFAANPHVSGAGGGHDLNLHQFARDGMTLLGHLRGATDERIHLALDLHDSLFKVDQFEIQLLGRIDEAIARRGIDAPEEQRPNLRDGFAQMQISEVDIEAAGISSVIWAAGYSFDFGFIKRPVTDGDGFPIQQRGVTNYPGLYFVGMPWLPTQKSGLLVGVGDNAAFIAEYIATNKTSIN